MEFVHFPATGSLPCAKSVQFGSLKATVEKYKLAPHVGGSRIDGIVARIDDREDGIVLGVNGIVLGVNLHSNGQNSLFLGSKET